MLSNQKIKLINSLEIKKFRSETGLFIVEGEKMVDEVINSAFKIDEIFALPHYLNSRQFGQMPFSVTEISDAQLTRISQLKTPNQVLALVHIPHYQLNVQQLESQLVLALDNLQDPGNLGTIIRTASWFGIKHLVCSANTVDAYNPKVVQATMGALFNCAVYYTNIAQFIQQCAQRNVPVYATSLQGQNIYQQSLTANGVIIMGNESAGVSPQILEQVPYKLFLPKYSDAPNTESLNVSVATALVCAEFKRRFPLG